MHGRGAWKIRLMIHRPYGDGPEITEFFYIRSKNA